MLSPPVSIFNDFRDSCQLLYREIEAFPFVASRPFLTGLSQKSVLNRSHDFQVPSGSLSLNLLYPALALILEGEVKNSAKVVVFDIPYFIKRGGKKYHRKHCPHQEIPVY